ncbi:MAG: hypothetical protein HIU91_06550 [Acidobacteria bacterium]|nr:hypothetical protein [Acidobacteriota bacterium]
MGIDVKALDEMQRRYKDAVDAWVAAIRREEEIASANHTEAQIDQWETAGFAEEEARKKAKQAKKEYEDGLREEFFNF